MLEWLAYPESVNLCKPYNSIKNYELKIIRLLDKATAHEVKDIINNQPYFALGIVVKSPQRSEDLKRIARPEGERPRKRNKNNESTE